MKVDEIWAESDEEKDYFAPLEGFAERYATHIQRQRAIREYEGSLNPGKAPDGCYAYHFDGAYYLNTEEAYYCLDDGPVRIRIRARSVRL